jgi:hypothetical protein|tara:strand:+ start:1886 stop:2719 length:834 start_codon:yes stop_codon:yes gene_type:complete
MPFDFGGLSAVAWKWLTSFVFWGIGLVLVLLVVFGSLVVRKKKKLIYPAIELTDLGAGKIGFTRHKAGWFKTRTIFFGLFDYGGEDILKLKDGRVIQSASSEDFHDIDGKRGLLITRKSDDPAILVPINKAGTSDNYEGKDKKLVKRFLDLVKKPITPVERKEDPKFTPVKAMELINPKLLLEIAPADYRDASSKIVFDAEKETRDKWEKLTPLLVFGTMAIVFLITIILIVQMVKQGQTESKDLILEAGRISSEQLNTVCKGFISQAEGIASTTAP